MTRDEWLRLERLYNLVQPDRIVTGLRSDGGYDPIALFEERIKATDDVDGLRVQIATVHRNDMRKQPTHPDNEREYHMAELLCVCVNALPDMIRERQQREAP